MLTLLQHQRIVKRTPAARSSVARPTRMPGQARPLLGLVVALTVPILAAPAAIAVRLEASSQPVLPPSSGINSRPDHLSAFAERAPATAAVAPRFSGAGLEVREYQVRPGDTIWSIARRFGLRLDTVISWNGIGDARQMRAGTALAIPSRDGLKYIVRRGDTLQGIARSARIALPDIMDGNGLTGSAIRVGQRLFLPGARMDIDELNGVLGSLFVWPARGGISSFFGSRSNPFTGAPEFHAGIDIANAQGTPVCASMAGTVRDIGFESAFGLYIVLCSGDYQTQYSHLARSLVSEGEKVRQGQQIAEMGSTGLSTGPHLDFRIFRNGKAMDPLRFLRAGTLAVTSRPGKPSDPSRAK